MMLVFTLAVSRLVPILFLLSVLLFLSRFLYDRYSSKNKFVGKTVLFAVLVAGLIYIVPFVMRGYAVTAAEAFYLKNHWNRADHYFSLHSALGGTLGSELTEDWVEALMIQRNWVKAEQVVLSTFRHKGSKVEADPRLVLFLGICRYYANRFDLADKTFAVLDSADTKYLSNYFRGRIAEKSAQSQSALSFYLSSMEQQPNFLPAVFHSIRLSMVLGDKQRALSILANARDLNPASLNEPNLRACREALEGTSPIPSSKEFMIVQISH